MSKKEQLPELTHTSNPGFLALRPSLSAFLLYLAATLVIFAPVLLKPFASPDSISQAFPVYQFNRTYFLSHFSLPFWYPFINGGTPFIEGMHFNHLFDLPIYFLPIPLGIGYRAILFVLLAGFFAFLFFRSSGFSQTVSLLAGLVYLLSGDAVTYTAIGHYGKVVNMAFLPLVLLFINKGLTEKKLLFFLLAGLPLGFMIKGHPQIFFYNFMIIMAYSFFKLLFLSLETREKKIWLTAIIGMLILGITSALVSIDNLVGQLQFVSMTSRGGGEIDPAQRWAFATSWSLHPLELLGYFLPGVFGLQNQTYMGWRPFVSTSDYLGVIVILTALFGVVRNWKDRTVKLLAFITLFAVLIGFGSFFTPYFKLFYNFVPMFKSFRVPSSIYIPVAFFLVWFFAIGLRSILEMKKQEPADKKWLKILIFSTLGIALLLSLFLSSSAYTDLLKNNAMQKINYEALVKQYGIAQVDSYLSNIVAGTLQFAKTGLPALWIFSIGFVLLLLIRMSGKLKDATFVFLIGALIAIDLYVVDKQFIHNTENYNQVSAVTDDIRFLQKDKSKFRLMPVPPQIDNESNKWVFFGLESAFGYNAVGLKIYDDVQNSGLLGNLNFLGLFNVKYLLANQLLNDPRLKLVYQGGKAVYSNREWLPRAFFVPAVRTLTQRSEIFQAIGSPTFDPRKEAIIEDEAEIALPKTASPDNRLFDVVYDYNEIRMKTDIVTPTFLFLSEIFYPKWECFIDGKKVRIHKTDYLFRGVFVPEGKHDVLFRYRNDGTYLLTFLTGLLSSLFLIVLMIKKRKSFLP
jgi:hypothetical protein